ncbi:AbrB/MazE/SpoVT family DNA-binding domain-containing protein [Pseudomonas sp. TE3610]
MLGTINRKGQITIPKVFRLALNLEAGDQVDFKVGAEGELILTFYKTDGANCVPASADALHVDTRGS